MAPSPVRSMAASSSHHQDGLRAGRLLCRGWADLQVPRMAVTELLLELRDVPGALDRRASLVRAQRGLAATSAPAHQRAAVHADLPDGDTGRNELILAGHADDDHIRKRPLIANSDACDV